MSITAAKLQVEFGSSGVDAVKNDITGLSNSLEGIGQKFTNVGQKMTMFVTAPIVAGLGASYMQAAGLEQAIGKVDAVYGDMSQSVMDWSRNSSTAFGMSQKDALSMVGTYGQIMQAQGMTMDQSAEYSQTLIGLSADMSAFSDRDITESSNAIRAALTGEYESLKSFGIVLKAADVEQEALNLSIADGSGEVTEAHRVQARYNLVMKQTTQMQGQFARESKGASGQLAIFKANMADLGANIGAVLLPVGTKITQMLNDMLQAFMKLPSGVTTTIVVVAALAAAIGPLLMVIGTMATGLAALPAIIALLTSPILLVVAGVAAFAAGLVLLYTQSEAFRNMIGAMGSALDALTGGAISAAIGKLGELYDVFQMVFGGGPVTKQGTLDLVALMDVPYSDWVEMPDGTIKNADLNITATGSGPGFITKVENAAAADGFDYTMNVDVTGDDVPDALKILDSKDHKDGTYTLTTSYIDEEGQTKTFMLWYDSATDKTIILDMDASGAITEIGKTREEMSTLERKVDNVQTKLMGMAALIDLWALRTTRVFEAITNLVIIAESSVTKVGTLIGIVVDDVTTSITMMVDLAIIGINKLIDVANKVPGIDIGKVGDDENQPGEPSIPKQTGSSGPLGMTVPDLGIKALYELIMNYDKLLPPATSNTGAFDAALAGLGDAGVAASHNMNLMASSATFTDTAIWGAAANIQGAGSSIGSTFAGIAANVTSQSAAANANATAQFSSMSANIGGHFMGMQAAAALQMALMASSATTQGNATMTNMVGALAGGMARVAVTMMMLNTAVSSAGATAASTAYSIGANISSSFASGMYAFMGQITAAANAMVNTASAALRAKAMISSPSRLFRQYGEYVGEGFEQGITGSLPAIHQAADAMIGAGIPSLGFGSSMATGVSSSSTSTISINFNGDFYGSNREELDAWADGYLVPAMVNAINDERRGQVR